MPSVSGEILLERGHARLAGIGRRPALAPVGATRGAGRRARAGVRRCRGWRRWQRRAAPRLAVAAGGGCRRRRDLDQLVAVEPARGRLALLRGDLVLAARTCRAARRRPGTRSAPGCCPRTWRVRPVATNDFTADRFFSPPSASRAAVRTAAASPGDAVAARTAITTVKPAVAPTVRILPIETSGISGTRFFTGGGRPAWWADRRGPRSWDREETRRAC